MVKLEREGLYCGYAMYLLGEVDTVFYCLEPAFSPVKWTLACPREGGCKDPVRSEIKKGTLDASEISGLVVDERSHLRGGGMMAHS